MIWRGLICTALCSLLFACQGENESEYYGNLLESPSGLVLEQSEHEIGWGETNCTTCHLTGNYHQVRDDRESGFDMEQIHAFVVGDQLDSCRPCHGSNGVNQ